MILDISPQNWPNRHLIPRRLYLTPFIPRYTCDECIKGLEWVEMYIEDPIMIAEYTIYLEQNYCLSELKSILRI